MRKRALTLRTLLLNQAVALAAVTALLHVFLRTGAGRSRPIANFVARFLAERLRWPDPLEIGAAIALAAALVFWNHLYQWLVPVGDSITKGEWRPGTRLERGAAALLVLTTSFTEEILFRGIVYPAAAWFLGAGGGLVLSALVFSLVHSEKGVHGRIAVFVYGLLFGAPLLFGASLVVPILAHALLNAVAFFGWFGTGDPRES